MYEKIQYPPCSFPGHENANVCEYQDTNEKGLHETLPIQEIKTENLSSETGNVPKYIL